MGATDTGASPIMWAVCTLCPVLASRTGCSPHHHFPPPPPTSPTGPRWYQLKCCDPTHRLLSVFLKSVLQSCSLIPSPRPQTMILWYSSTEEGVGIDKTSTSTNTSMLPASAASIPCLYSNEEPPCPQGSLLQC